ncbi:pro-sigmaK processing inhibitor BofA family protein [Oscillospiraceae bacterium MB08-C2-2]|nr:pro-sigmaK processing inhibitor BofA family protein [Oscillospiraceae bacterium MB08-C2-2]
MNISPWVYGFLLIAGAALFGYYIKIGRFFRCMLFTAVTGFLALGALWLLGRFVPLALAVTPLTIFTSGLLGIPGLLILFVLNLI